MNGAIHHYPCETTTTALVNGPNWPFALTENDRDEVLAFLARRPIQNVIMAGWIYDRGVVSLAHRGAFYGCRNSTGDLEGVALLGRNTMFDATNPEVAGLFGEAAREQTDVKVVFAEPSLLEVFWNRYAPDGLRPRLVSNELLYEFHKPFGKAQPNGLRIATTADLDKIVVAHAEMVMEETGIDPLTTDAEGFRHRCAERVEKGRVWVYVDGDELIFKSDVVTETPQAVYVEGAWVNPRFRRGQIGRQCLTALSHLLLSRAPAGCFFVNEDNQAAQQLYKSLGLEPLNSVSKYQV